MSANEDFGVAIVATVVAIVAIVVAIVAVVAVVAVVVGRYRSCSKGTSNFQKCQQSNSLEIEVFLRAASS
jgi:hypothetical protein